VGGDGVFLSSIGQAADVQAFEALPLQAASLQNNVESFAPDSGAQEFIGRPDMVSY
jgi:hypothetical protein